MPDIELGAHVPTRKAAQPNPVCRNSVCQAGLHLGSPDQLRSRAPLLWFLLSFSNHISSQALAGSFTRVLAKSFCESLTPALLLPWQARCEHLAF